MSPARTAARARLGRLLDATRRAVAPGTSREALVTRLEQSTGLSQPNIRAALDECLELEPSERELDALLDGVVPAPAAHVLLPSNVFVAAHRALALGLAAAKRVRVKPSRREPVFCAALHAQAPDLFELSAELTVAPGEHVFAYGSDTTLDSLRNNLPEGAVLHAHGSGFGVALVELDAAADVLWAQARAIARDTARFDQRGCLSPRFVLGRGDARAAAAFAERLAAALSELEHELPLGRLLAIERAEARWWLECAACFGRVWRASSGCVTLRDADAERFELESAAALEVPPAGRNLELVALARLEPALDAFGPWLTSVACDEPRLVRAVAERLPRVRVGALGQMQRPQLDGPADRRPDPHGERIVRAR